MEQRWGKQMADKYKFSPDLFLRDSFRVIIAGGGTGGVTVFIGEQLNYTNGDVIYLDFSQTSLNISQKRARARRLQNIIFVRSWIEGIRSLGMGLFEQS